MLGGYLIFLDQLGPCIRGIFFFLKESLRSGYILAFLLFKESPGPGYDLGGRGLVI